MVEGGLGEKRRGQLAVHQKKAEGGQFNYFRTMKKAPHNHKDSSVHQLLIHGFSFLFPSLCQNRKKEINGIIMEFPGRIEEQMVSYHMPSD